MTVTVRYFASIREALGSGETLEVGAGATVGSARDALIARSDAHAQALSRSRLLRSAVDQVMTDDAAPLRDGAELAFFPPVTGG